mmetsp:Transcript_3859/g.9539  ORF Transcript_3859/g.9539 Transcript_3859/m.9539 type:complete len:225 (+) Transcript_3859:1074-1748(+)
MGGGRQGQTRRAAGLTFAACRRSQRTRSRPSLDQHKRERERARGHLVSLEDEACLMHRNLLDIDEVILVLEPLLISRHFQRLDLQCAPMLQQLVWGHPAARRHGDLALELQLPPEEEHSLLEADLLQADDQLLQRHGKARERLALLEVALSRLQQHHMPLLLPRPDDALPSSLLVNPREEAGRSSRKGSVPSREEEPVKRTSAVIGEASRHEVSQPALPYEPIL